MKKALRILAIAAILPLMASVAISCKKKPNPNDDPDGPMPVLEETKYDEYVTAGIVSEYETESVRVLVSYDFGGDGTATLGFIDKEVTKALTKAEVTGEVYYEVYPYTVKDGAGNATDYVVEGFGTLSIEVVENTATGESTAVVTIKEEGSTEVDTVTATIPEKVEETTFSKNICRDWKVKELSVDGTGGDLKQRVGRRFTGCDLNEMMAYLKEKGINLNSDKLNYQMNVTLVRISEYGDITINFGETAVAAYKEYPVRKAYKVSVNPQYLKDADQNLGNIIKELVKDITFKEGSTASITVRADETALLKVTAIAETKDKKVYTINIEATLEQANKK